MEIKRLILGELATNCYIVIKNAKCIIIDPAANSKQIIENCANLKVEEILVTHHHFDHIEALTELENYYNINHNSHNSNSFKYTIIKTPGHNPDSLTFYFKEEKIMFTGDFLFYHTIGRYDFENSSKIDMLNSLDLISKYPDDIKIYPGHGRSTTLGEEKKYFNYYK